MKDKSSKAPVSIKRVVITSFLVDISDVLLNVAIAVISKSVVMLSQALQGGTDLLASGLLIIGLERSKKKSDKNYPFGYGRELYFWTMMSALIMLGVTSTLSILYGWRRFNQPEPLENLSWAIATLLFGFLSNSYAFSLSFKRIYKARHSHISMWRIFSRSPLIETKTTLVLDLMGALASLFGMFAILAYIFTGNARYDGLGAMIIGIMLAVLSFVLLDGVRDMIVGRSASTQTINAIKHSVLSLPEVEEILDLKTMYLGPANVLANVEVHIVDKLDTNEIEKLIDKIEKKIKEKTPQVRHIQIELESPRS